MIKVICGPMSCGKSEELIRLVTRHLISGKKVFVFKPEIDTRDGATISSRTGAKYEDVVVVKNSVDIVETISKSLWWFKNKELYDHQDIFTNERTVIAIDEAQFFDDDIVSVVKMLSYNDATVIISGLEKDYLGNPFGPMPQLLAIADEVEKLSAVCMKCKKDGATFTYKKDKSNSEQVQVGGDSIYEARCCGCWQQ